MTFPNDLSSVPEGALSVADNIIIDRDNEAEPRRGLDYVAHGGVQSQFSEPTFRANKLFFYQSQTLAQYSSNLLAYHNSSTGWSPYSGTYAPPSATVPMRSAQANQNFYFTTSQGVYKLDSYSGTPAAIGVPPGLDITTTLTATVTPTGTTTSGSNVVTAVSAITGIAVGMTIVDTGHSGIPANTVITSFTANTITLSANASASNTGTALSIAAPSTWLSWYNASANSQVSTAYRIVWGIKDANNNVIYGAPSQRSDITNTGTANAAINVNFTIPAGITTAHFYQIYRAAAVILGSNPNDEMNIVYEGNPVAADITNKYLTICDILPDALRIGATIYTAQSQEGIANGNAPPPLAADLATFKNCLFFGNTQGLQSYSLTLLGVGAPTGLVSGDTIVIGVQTYTADTTETVSTGHFQVVPVFLQSQTGSTHTSTTVDSLASTTGVTVGMTVAGTGIPVGTFVTAIPGGTSITISQAATASASVSITIAGDSAAQAIRDTALSLVRVINRNASSTVYAYYLSGPNDLPGKMLFQARTVGQVAFTSQSARATSWSPVITSAQTSTNDKFKNALFYSKVSQPEAVPLANYIFVGSADKAILRIIALRDSLFILKEDGIFRLYGTDPTNFQVSPLDYTSILIAPESAVALNNQIYAFTTQGVVAVGEQGVQIMSHPIEGDLTSLIAANYSLLQTSTFGVAYESDRAYYLFCISNAADTQPTQYHRYNYITNAWVRGTMTKTCGGVNPADNRLYLGNGLLDIIDVERKNLTYSDYADYSSTQTISGVTGSIVSITSPDTIIIGSILWQSATVFGTVASYDSIGGTVTTTLPTAFANGSVDVLAPIQTDLVWIPTSFGNPGMSKQIREATPLFKSDFNGTAYVGFSSDISPDTEYEAIAGGSVGAWGLFAWGGPFETLLGVPYGGDPRRRPIRVVVPRNQQRCSLLTVSFTHAYGFSPWLLSGISLNGNISSERTGN